MTQPLPPKKEVALALLERSNVDVYLDPRGTGVVVPPQFRKEPRLILKVGLNMPVPIPDLRLDDESMSCTLSFSRTPFYCVVPWASVFAMVGEDGRGMVWPDDVPKELAVRVVDDKSSASLPSDRESSPAPSSRGGRPRSNRGLRGVPREGAVASVVPADRPSRPKRPKKKKDVPAWTEEPAQRPMLVAVPPAESPPGDCPARTTEAPRTNRPKRELPPYLRVVK